MRELTDEERDMAIDAERDAAEDRNELNGAFEEFLLTRRDHRDGLSARQQLWLAFEAGAEYALAKIRLNTVR